MEEVTHLVFDQYGTEVHVGDLISIRYLGDEDLQVFDHWEGRVVAVEERRFQTFVVVQFGEIQHNRISVQAGYFLKVRLPKISTRSTEPLCKECAHHEDV